MIAYRLFPTSSAERICDKSSFFYHRFVFLPLPGAELELTNCNMLDKRLSILGSIVFRIGDS